MNSLLKILKRIVHKILNYSIYAIYEYPSFRPDKKLISPSSSYKVSKVTKKDISKNSNICISNQEWYGGYESFIYAYIKGELIIALCVYWYGSRYKTRNFWELHDNEAKLVQLYTLPEYRGKGIATALISNSVADIMNNGFEKVYARVWHSNLPSKKAFEKSNWQQIATVYEIKPFNKIKPIRVQITS